jgi:hypothetical protein
MKPQCWEQPDQLFHSALQDQASERAAFLDEVCADDESLHKQVEELLAAHNKAAGFIEQPALDAEARALANEEKRLIAGQTTSHSDSVTSGRRRHGRRLFGRGHSARSQSRVEDFAGKRRLRSTMDTALRPGSEGCFGSQPSEHHHHCGALPQGPLS